MNIYYTLNFKDEIKALDFLLCHQGDLDTVKKLLQNKDLVKKINNYKEIHPVDLTYYITKSGDPVFRKNKNNEIVTEFRPERIFVPAIATEEDLRNKEFVICPNLENCKLYRDCAFSHDLRNTKMCKNKDCRQIKCTFAHDVSELKTLPDEQFKVNANYFPFLIEPEEYFEEETEEETEWASEEAEELELTQMKSFFNKNDLQPYVETEIQNMSSKELLKFIDSDRYAAMRPVIKIYYKFINKKLFNILINYSITFIKPVLVTDKISFLDLCYNTNPEVLDMIKKNYNKKDKAQTLILGTNPIASELVRQKNIPKYLKPDVDLKNINPKKLSEAEKKDLCKNPAAIDFLKANQGLFYKYPELSENPAAWPILSTNKKLIVWEDFNRVSPEIDTIVEFDKIMPEFISMNPNAFEWLTRNPEYIDWKTICRNPAAISALKEMEGWGEKLDI